jgi:membrane protease YdiL (CAAX protease family)
VSTRVRSTISRDGDERLVGALVVAGLLALLIRPYALGAASATPLFVAVIGSLGILSLLAPAGSAAAPRLATPTVLAMGALAVLATTLVVGGGIPLPHGPLSLALSCGAALSEELFFRRMLYGSLERFHPLLAILGSAIVFAAVHIPLYGGAVFWVDLGAGLLFSWQRWASGGWGASAATHAMANLLAVIR